ncbi:MAG: protein-L-isoaspartate O-methyltransferase, partial [bacterium]
MTAGGSSDEFRKEREQMVEQQLKQRDIDSEAVLEAFRTVPRHEFVNPKHRDHAYEDRALPTTAGQTISQPYMVATMTEELMVKPGMKALEVGTGSGYQTAILLELGAEVYTVEKVPELSERARAILVQIGYGDSVELKVGDGTKGWPD